MISTPFNLDLESFLRGTDQTKSLDIDEIFAVSFDDLWEKHYHDVSPRGGIAKFPILKHSEVVRGVYYTICDDGIIAVDGSSLKAIGWYMWATLALDPNWQGLGLGRELVIARITHAGENPVWNLDTPAYSPAGLGVHESAWMAMRNT